VIEERQGLKIACLEELGYMNGWISRGKLIEVALLGKTPYEDYLKLIAAKVKFLDC
jgi:glucose-1-phosphate thymidylyltransferase